jgi:hypothetical protein
VLTSLIFYKYSTGFATKQTYIPKICSIIKFTFFSIINLTIFRFKIIVKLRNNKLFQREEAFRNNLKPRQNQYYGRRKSMEGYESPVILYNEDVAEGIFAASGSVGCYTVTSTAVQSPETGRENYVIQVNAAHNATHTSSSQVLTISFNQPVTYVSSHGSLQSGDGTSTLQIGYNYTQNETDNIGLADITVSAGAGLEITSVSISD